MSYSLHTDEGDGDGEASGDTLSALTSEAASGALPMAAAGVTYAPPSARYELGSDSASLLGSGTGSGSGSSSAPRTSGTLPSVAGSRTNRRRGLVWAMTRRRALDDVLFEADTLGAVSVASATGGHDFSPHDHVGHSVARRRVGGGSADDAGGFDGAGAPDDAGDGAASASASGAGAAGAVAAPDVRVGLARRLGAGDLTLMGVGATLGAGVYVLAGVVAKNQAGPAIVLSFAVAGFASILSGLSYAEFAGRCPAAGSAYLYSYVTVGELVAWVTGWNLILEYIIGAASVSRAWSGYFDSLTGHAVSKGVDSLLGGWKVPGLGSSPDFVALGITLLLTFLLAFGVKESARANAVLTVLNLVVIAFVIIAGSAHADTSNWTPFVPFGVKGIFSGAGTAFFGFVGFDVVAGMAEEATKPQRNIPIGIMGSILICCAAYIGIAGVLTLMVPYSSLDVTAPLSSAFAAKGLEWAKDLIAVGAVCGLSTSLMGSIFPLPRIVYAIAGDGLLFPWLGKVNKYQSPANATYVCGGLAGLMAFAFDIDQLAEMMSVGTLMSYTLVSACVLILRYRRESATGAVKELGADALSDNVPICCGSRRVDPERASGWSVSVFCIGAALLGVALHAFPGGISNGEALPVLFLLVSIVTMAVPTVVLYMLPTFPSTRIAFKCPCVPLVPLVSLFVNIYLILSLSKWTWVRFSVWMVIGFAIYFGYGMKHSVVGSGWARRPRAAADRSRQTSSVQLPERPRSSEPLL